MRPSTSTGWRAATGATTEAQGRVRAMISELAEARVEDIFDEGLHEFLTRFIDEVAALSSVIHRVYLSGETR